MMECFGLTCRKDPWRKGLGATTPPLSTSGMERRLHGLLRDHVGGHAAVAESLHPEALERVPRVLRQARPTGEAASGFA